MSQSLNSKVKISKQVSGEVKINKRLTKRQFQ